MYNGITCEETVKQDKSVSEIEDLMNQLTNIVDRLYTNYETLDTKLEYILDSRPQADNCKTLAEKPAVYSPLGQSLYVLIDRLELLNRKVIETSDGLMI